MSVIGRKTVVALGPHFCYKYNNSSLTIENYEKNSKSLRDLKNLPNGDSHLNLIVMSGSYSACAMLSNNSVV